MKLIYLSKENLDNSLFVKDLAFNFKSEGGSIVIHEPFSEKISDNRFVTKRISSLMSEAMIVNNAFSGDQRGLFTQDKEEIRVNLDFLGSHLRIVPIFITNSLIKRGSETIIGDVFGIMKVLRSVLPIEETIVFPRNTRSPLAAGKEVITTQEDYDRLIGIYEEEATALGNARHLAPATLASPLNFSR